ncbi:RimK family protein [Lacimicrobium alkaliphilum]|uniref:Carboxylate--amine ligase n=1 Tax=Lacimicrobium alkaliphilum TaxID=1526571 RepID=A0A0U3AC46_9ALTE|nr:RimK family protein [Lacimicrobium alkaliphilum]ALS98606.1 carboxylate--amine ligase [Lacimicrobium alkaliphilum]
MSGYYVVVDNLDDWAPYFPSREVISFDQYLAKTDASTERTVRILNLCRNKRALGRGYYCSLLAEARGHKVIPDISTINDLRRKKLYSLRLEEIAKSLHKLKAQDDSNKLTLRVFLGETQLKDCTELAKAVFDRFPAPILEVTLVKNRHWSLDKIQPLSLQDISNESEQEFLANTLERFSNRLWRKPKARKHYRYDVAMLCDASEAMPPSDKKALNNFVKAADKLGINLELIGKKDYVRLAEYDGLFIRETTSIDHHTYRFAKKAEAEGMVVIDDPTSILRCTNKVYLADLLRTNKVPTPKTLLLSNTDKQSLEHAIEYLGLPIVLKIPDGAFSRGMFKATNMSELVDAMKQLTRTSALVLAQEFLYTDYDWRIGVLNNKPLYACRYFMVKGHWQIYRHDDATNVATGGFETMPTYEVPPKVLDAALRACKLIGDGFYGVDIKQTAEGKVAVIEVNDNPSIDSGVEDKFLGQALYQEVMAEFLRRMELQ